MIAYMLGYAFARTRSLGVPTLLHAAHNMLLYVAVWYSNL
jgi:membrane protease YdiL (CAAX protease family)